VHPHTERVTAALRAGGATGAVRELSDSARTAVEAAAALGVPVGAIVKSLVFAADGAPLLVLASGDHQVDTAKVAAVVGAAAVKRADVDLVRSATGYPAPLPTVVDRHLAIFDAVWAAAGTPHTVFPTTYDELLRLTSGTAADVARDG
jgi:prolyl-tRNA editing enzyme YbaK/EbsC (Cys-tRNA(Pro) deacylase)